MPRRKSWPLTRSVPMKGARSSICPASPRSGALATTPVLISTAACWPDHRHGRCPSTRRSGRKMGESCWSRRGGRVNDPGHDRGWRGWLDRRYQITPLIEFLRHKEVSKEAHYMIWYKYDVTTI